MLHPRAPDSPCIIDSVTSASVQELTRQFGWTVEKRTVPYRELSAFTEVLGAGTGLALLPIRSITRRLPATNSAAAVATETAVYLPDEQARGGPVYLKLLARLRAIQRGTTPDEFGWRFAVRSGRRWWTVNRLRSIEYRTSAIQRSLSKPPLPPKSRVTSVHREETSYLRYI